MTEYLLRHSIKTDLLFLEAVNSFLLHICLNAFERQVNDLYLNTSTRGFFHSFDLTYKYAK